MINTYTVIRAVDLVALTSKENKEEIISCKFEIDFLASIRKKSLIEAYILKFIKVLEEERIIDESFRETLVCFCQETEETFFLNMEKHEEDIEFSINGSKHDYCKDVSNIKINIYKKTITECSN